MRISKKAELTTQQIVMITIIIVSFVVLLYFLFLLNPGETSEKQICYNSVVLADKGGGLVGSLDCRTNYVTIESTEKEAVMKSIADEMADCWWMFGEGKIDYVGSLKEDVRCAICSRITFSEDTKGAISEISYSELAEYMRTNKSSHDTSQSYLKYLYDVNSLESANTEFTLKASANSPPITTANDYVVLTGIDPELVVKDKYLKVNLVKTTEISSTRCEVFDITKA